MVRPLYAHLTMRSPVTVGIRSLLPVRRTFSGQLPGEFHRFLTLPYTGRQLSADRDAVTLPVHHFFHYVTILLSALRLCQVLFQIFLCAIRYILINLAKQRFIWYSYWYSKYDFKKTCIWRREHPRVRPSAANSTERSSAVEVFWDIVHTFDYEILLQLFQHWRGGVSDAVWTVFSTLGNGGALWIALAVILLFFRKTRRAGAAMLAALLIGLLVGNVFLKEWVMRPRPFVTHPELTALLDPGDQWSFPSGHTLSSFAAATALCFFHRKAGAAAYVVAALIGFSRLYACVHYPTDVLAGLLIGILCGLLAVWLVDRLFDRIHAARLRKGVQ